MLPDLVLAPALWHTLPLEVVLLILETIALDPEEAPQLALISKAVQRCIDPILYGSVCLQNEYIASLFARTVSSPCVNKHHVKFICLDQTCDPDDFKVISRVCTGMQSLAVYRTDAVDMLGTEHPPPLQRLFVSTLKPAVLLALLQKPLFPHLTHLDLDLGLNAPLENMRVPSRLPMLTHFSLQIRQIDESYLKFLSTTLPQQLRVCLLKVYGPSVISALKDSCGRGTCDHDVRIVFANTNNMQGAGDASASLEDHYITNTFTIGTIARFFIDWAGPCCVRDIWELAEDVIERRRKKLQKEQYSKKRADTN